MALRLTGSALTSDRQITAGELSSRAWSLLSVGDLDAYRGLFGDAAAIEDVHRRYQARKALLETGLAAAQRRSDAEAPAFYATVAGCALDVLDDEPAEPVLLNGAGVAMYELWSLAGANALFNAAKRLDPWLEHVASNLAQLAERRRISRGRRLPPLHPDVPQLAERAKALAERARPAEGLTLSLCMIVRDEEEMLPRCLEAVAAAVDEIVIVDTGSTDATVEIARSFGARVIEREWTGSFSDARNVSFDAATGDWLLYLDADEVLVEDDRDALRALTGQTWREAFFLMETNFTGDIEDGTAVTHNALRVFRNRPEYRFEGRLHEQIAQQLPGFLPERLESTTVRVSHYGYLGTVRDAREKSRRNIELLRHQQDEGPPTPFLHYNLGSEYAAAGDAGGALAEFERAWTLVTTDGGRYEFAPSLITRLVRALRVCGRLDDAIARADEGLERFPGFTDLVLEQAVATSFLGRRQEAIELFERCIEMGDAPAVYTATVGCGTYLPRISLAEIRLAQGEVAQARELLEYCIERYPGFFGSVLPYATALLLSGMPGDDVVAEVERRLGGRPNSTARFMLGTALAERGAPEAAERQFRAVLAQQPRVTRARVALGEVLLAQRRYVDAADESGQVDVRDPLAAIATRTELFGRLAAGDTESAERANARAVEAGLGPEELAVFSGWIELARGAEAPATLPAASAGLLATLLEALLRVQDFETFAFVLPLARKLALPQRERRELLAGVYMRRGFVASAAEQWLAVCETEPDARALVGLAQIASARGMPEQAASFAREALIREPANETALSIAESCAATRG